MAFDDRTCWLLSGGPRARHVDDFVAGGIASTGWDWPQVGDLDAQDDATVFLALERLGRSKPAEDLRDLRMFAGRIAAGDVLVVHDGPAGDLLFGEVAGPYEHRPGTGSHRHVRPVRWFGRLATDQAEPLLLATATGERRPVRRLPEQVRWQRLAGEVDDVLGRPPTDVRRRTTAPAARRAPTDARRTAATPAAARPAPVPDRICPACGLLRSPTLFGSGEEVCRDCA